jgi:toxin-antitoxin system PIN domain toxin
LERVDDAASILFCRTTQQAFLRLMTNRALFARYGNPALTNEQAWNAYEALLSDDRIIFRSDEPPGLESTWREFALRTNASSHLWMDAYLAAFARAAGCQMVTTDSGFRQFEGLDLLLLGSP